VNYRIRMTGRGYLDVVDPWVNWDWLSSHVPLFIDAVDQHIFLTAVALVCGLAIALPVGLAAHRWRPLRSPVLTTFGILYTIPSLAFFALLVPYTGLTALTAEIALVSYTVLILVRNVMVGLAAVPADVVDAADGMGYRGLPRLLQVELPLALPAIFAGLRIATVTTIGLVTITAVIGLGGLAQLLLRGLIENFHTPLVVATVLSVVLAFIADLGLAGVQRIAVPWSRNG
jgi:osmoprotectant transport system permease protein